MNKPEVKYCHNRRFTIIELLIVISIIVIIAGLLLPALNAAREKARTISCAANLKQVGLAVTQYMPDHNDYFPSRQWANDVDKVGADFQMPLSPYLNIEWAMNSSANAQNRSRFAVWRCPSDKSYGNVKQWEVPFSYDTTTLLANPSYWGGASLFAPRTGITSRYFAAPSELCITSEAKDRGDIRSNNTIMLALKDFDPDVKFELSRHNGVNILHADGHAAFYKRPPTYSVKPRLWRPWK